MAGCPPGALRTQNRPFFGPKDLCIKAVIKGFWTSDPGPDGPDLAWLGLRGEDTRIPDKRPQVKEIRDKGPRIGQFGPIWTEEPWKMPNFGRF